MDNTWQVTTDRFVAFIDLMGFTNEVATSSHEDVYEFLLKLNKLCNDIQDATKPYGQNVKIICFSDSVIVLSKSDNGVASFVDFSNAVAKIVAISICHRVPIKGGCAYGKVTWDDENSILCGIAYINAVQMEGKLNYYGVACHHSIDDFFLNIRTTHSGGYLFESKTTFKDCDVVHYNIDWFYSALEAYYKFQNTVDENKSYIVDVINDLKANMSCSHRIYIENTLMMFNRYLDATHNIYWGRK